jgi:CheY-like chemotaxis protein
VTAGEAASRTSAPAIVLVEDDPDDAFLTIHALTRHGVQPDIVVARNGQSALDLLLPSAGHEHLLPRLVLLDLNLPRLGGFEVLDRLRADSSTADLPVIALTNTRIDEDKLAAYPPPTGFTRKPLDFTAFQRVSVALGLPLWA